MLKVYRNFKEKDFFRSVFTLISATSLAQLVSILIYPVLTILYTPAEHGTFALYLSIITVTGIISTGKYEGAILMPVESREAVNLAALSVILSLLVSIILLILIALFGRTFTLWLGNPEIRRWLLFIPLSTFLIGLFQTLTFLSNRKKQYGIIAFSNVSQSVINSAVKVTTSDVFRPGAGLIWGAITGQIIGTALFLWSLIKKELSSLKEIRLSQMLKVASEYSLFPRYNLIHNLTNNLSGNLPVFVISSYYTSAEVGLYSLGFLMVFRPMTLITGSFTQVFSQKIITAYHHRNEIKIMIRRMTKWLFWSGLPFFLIAGIFGPAIIRFVFGDNWVTSGKYMQVLLPWLFLVFISSPVSFLPDMLGQQKMAMWLDMFKLLARIMALGVGVYLNKLYLALALFSLISAGFTGFSLYWYLKLAETADQKKIREHLIGSEEPAAGEEKIEFRV